MSHDEIDVLCIGNVSTDILFPGTVMPGPGEKVRCATAAIHGGGMAANTAMRLAQLGLRSGVLACVGDDVFGTARVAELVAAGVDVSRIQVSRSASGITAIASSPDDKRMIIAEGANRDLVVDHSVLAGARHLHVSATTEENARQAIRFASVQGLPTSVDVASPTLWSLVPEFSYVIMNQGELCQMTREGDARAALRALRLRCIVVMLRSGGCIIQTPAEVVRLSCKSVRAVDTTGAGDAFSAGFLFGLSRGFEVVRAGACGVAAATEVVQHVGARAGVLNRHAIEVESEVLVGSASRL